MEIISSLMISDDVAAMGFFDSQGEGSFNGFSRLGFTFYFIFNKILLN